MLLFRMWEATEPPHACPRRLLGTGMSQGPLSSSPRHWGSNTVGKAHVREGCVHGILAEEDMTLLAGGPPD